MLRQARRGARCPALQKLRQASDAESLPDACSPGESWRSRPESNWGKRICNPLPNHSATGPSRGQEGSNRFRRFKGKDDGLVAPGAPMLRPSNRQPIRRVKTKKHCGHDHVESAHKKQGQTASAETIQVQNVPVSSSMPGSSKRSVAATVGCASLSTDTAKFDDRSLAPATTKLCDVAVGSELKYQDVSVGSSVTPLLYNASTGMSGSLGGVKW